MAEKSRSNQPRIGSRLQEDQTSDYHFAVEVSGQPAKTPQEKAYKKKAEAEAEDQLPPKADKDIPFQGMTEESKVRSLIAKLIKEELK